MKTQRNSLTKSLSLNRRNFEYFSFHLTLIFTIFGVNAFINPLLAKPEMIFVQNDISYTVKLKKKSLENLTFSIAYKQSDGNTRTTNYKGSCGSDTVNILEATTVSPLGDIVSQEIASQAVAIDISPESSWEFGNTIREALILICK
ncbi:hypothetical protein VB715_05270 [Crocosphaera sp. UHCC 0190]|uniref:hypothetical protein n=1 Tax=Crocosphaera sp. UHCC 0190 TaxID=3110246 RepID=UPI002B2069DC|nr:hypothetical protein [Crocosphaera sp. UHCC 0190]MEA5509170.1 hypothetical protein [Crocosphaera sp. UHCC 0190]